MNQLRSISTKVITIACLIFATVQLAAGQSISSPKEHFGFSIGDNYRLATYTQTSEYFKKLANSDRVKLTEIGMTEEGRTQYMLIISSPQNIKNLDKYKDISRKLALADGISENEARRLSVEGKPVVWIDGGLHATEVVGTHQLIETAWKLVSGTDSETREILDNVIVLLVHANPDGQELVSNWYMQEADTLKRKMNIPRLYQKYAGHDNNRDFYMTALRESKNMSRQLYVEWFPQIMYNHHQSGPAGTVLAGPPYRDPFSYVYDPLVITTIDGLGAAMNNRLNAEGKPGYTMRTGASFSTWYNGGLRTTTYYHNMVGLLTEIIGSPTPGEIPLVPDRLLPTGATPNPVTPQKWFFRQSIEYSVSLNYAVLNYASRNASDVLFNIWRMGMNSIEKGSRDNWTATPSMIDVIRKKYDESRSTAQSASTDNQPRQFMPSRVPLRYYEEVFNDPDRRDARAYIIPSDQEDMATAVKFINALIRSGIVVKKAEKEFSANGKLWPSGSYVIFSSQAFRPHVIDMFEPQDHPNDLQYPGGPPIPPYDAAGWTLAYQMGVVFERVLTEVSGQFARLEFGVEEQMPRYDLQKGAKSYILKAAVNNNFRTVNELLKNKIDVKRIAGTGDFVVQASGKALSVLSKSATEYGTKPSPFVQNGEVVKSVAPARIGIWNRYGGSMESGWQSLVLEEFGFNCRFIYSQTIDSGDLRKRFDVLIFPSGAIPQFRQSATTVQGDSRPAVNTDIPEKYRWMSGVITAEKSIPAIKKFLDEGGTVITLESSTNLAYHLDLPVENALVKQTDGGKEVPLSSTEYYIPGSILKTDLVQGDIANSGLGTTGYIYFAQNPVFRFRGDSSASGLTRIAWFSLEKPLSSGWALGQDKLKGGIISFSAPYGKGRFYAFGADIVFRSQTHGMFKQLFNLLYTTK